MEMFFSWSEFIGTCFVVVLTIIILYLTWRDRQKSLSLKELQKQSSTLHKTFLELIKPNLVVDKTDHSDFLVCRFDIKNIGGQCFNLDYYFEGEFPASRIKLPKADSFASNSSYKCHFVFTKSEDFSNNLEVVFTFNDFENREYKQILIVEKYEPKELKRIYFKAPTLVAQ